MTISLSVILLFYTELPTMFITEAIMFFSITALMLGYSLEVANRFTSGSDDLLKTLLRVSTSNPNPTQKFIWLKRCASLPTLQWHLGRNYKLHNGTFFAIMNNIVVENSINLLIANKT